MTGRKLRQFNIVSTQNITAELARYNLPDSAYALITSSPRGYMVTELFMEYLNKVLVPGVEGLRKELGKEKATAGLLMDGMKAHDSPEVRAILAKHNIRPLFLLPHASHLLQPLDCVLFGVFKRTRRQYIDDTIENKQGRRLLEAMDALDGNSRFRNIIAGWERAGFYKTDTNKVQINIEHVITGARAPNSDAKTAAAVKTPATPKAKRIRVFRGTTVPKPTSPKRRTQAK